MNKVFSMNTVDRAVQVSDQKTNYGHHYIQESSQIICMHFPI